jgi:hypothetical protein
MRLYYPIEVDLYKPYPLPIMEAQQNNIGRGAVVTLKANGAIIQPTNEGLTFWAKKPDGTVSFLAATLTGNNIQMDFTNQMLALPGMVQVEIRLTSGSGEEETDISTPIFVVRVNPSNINDSGVESQNEFTALQVAIGEVQSALSEVDELKKNGLKGDPGQAATIEIGTVTATEPGGAPSVTNAGTEQAAVLDFVLPRGEQGPKGNDGAAGKDGKEQIVFAAASAFPATGDPAMLYVDNTVIPAIIYTWSGSAYVQASADISTVMAMLATPFSETESYTTGKYVTYNGQYWRFTADKTAGAWDASKAEATNIGAELSALNIKISTNTFGTQVTLTKNVEYICPADGYFRITCGYERSSVARGYVNGAELLTLTSTNSETVTPDNTTNATVYVRAGMTIKYAGTNAKGYFRPLSAE